MKFKIIAILVSILILSNPAEAMKIDSYSVVSDIISINTIHQKILIEIQNDADTELKGGSISAPSDSEIISITDKYGDLKYALEQSGLSNISFQFSKPLQHGEKRIIILALETGGLINNRADYFEYLLVFTPKQNISGFEHIVTLPKGAKLYSPKQFAVVFPESEIDTIDNNVAIKWTANLTANEPQVFLARFRTEYTNWKLIGMIAAGSIMALFLAIYFQKSVKKYKERKKEDLFVRSLNLLNEREKSIIERIIRNPGIKQNELREILNYQKSGLSKIIGRLEARRLIDRKKYGKINRLYPGERLKTQ